MTGQQQVAGEQQIAGQHQMASQAALQEDLGAHMSESSFQASKTGFILCCLQGFLLQDDEVILRNPGV